MTESGRTAHTVPSFEEVEAWFRRFSEQVGGRYSCVAGISEREIELSKSNFNLWFDKTLLDPVLKVCGKYETPEELKEQFERYIKNLYVDCEYKRWSIRFFGRFTGFAEEVTGFRLRVTCAIEPLKNLVLVLGRRSKLANVRNVWQGPMIPEFLKDLFPVGIVKSRDLGELRTYLLQLAHAELERTYFVRSSDIEWGESYLNDRRIEECLLKMGDKDLVLSLGFGDYCQGLEGVFWELMQRVEYDDVDELQRSQELATTSLDVLAELGLIRDEEETAGSCS